MSVTDSEMPTESALECESESSTASDSGRESGLPTVPAWVPESASGRESVWVPESALGLAPGLEPESASDSVIPVLLARESALALASQLESAPDLVLGSVPGLEPESASGRESGLPTVPAWVPESRLESASQALGSAPELASDSGEDRNRRYRQIPSSPRVRLPPRIYPGR